MSDQECKHGTRVVLQCIECEDERRERLEAHGTNYEPGERQAVAERPFTSPNMQEPGYENLARILQSAYDQSAKGKGKERHANNKPFDEQPIMEIARMVGVGGHSYQICKKAQEATGMVERKAFDAAIAEFKGVIVYAAAAILLIEGMKK